MGLIPWLASCVTEAGSKLPTELAADYAPVDLATAQHPCTEILRQLRPLPYHVRIDPGQSNWVACPGGTRIFLPPNSFADSYNGSVNATVDLYISEATHNWETILYNVAQQIGPGRIPSTLGTVRIEAYADDRSLSLAADHPVLVLFPTMPQHWAYMHHGASLSPLVPFYWDYAAPQFTSDWTEDLMPGAQLQAPYPAFGDYGMADPVSLEFADEVHVVNKVLGKMIGESGNCPDVFGLLEREHKVGFRVNEQGFATHVNVTGVNAGCFMDVVVSAMKMIRWDLSRAGSRREWSFSLWELPVDVPATSAISDEEMVHMETLNPIYRGKLRQAIARFADSAMVERMAQEALVLQQLGWTTVDTGFPIDGTQPLTIELGDSLKGADAKVWLMLPGMHSVAEATRDTNGKFIFLEVPRKIQATIVALAYHKQLGPMFGMQSWTYGDRLRIPMKMEPFTVSQLRQQLQQ